MHIYLTMNWSQTLQQLVEIQQTFKIQKVDRESWNGSNISESAENREAQKYVDYVSAKEMLEFIKELDILTQEKTFM